MSRPAPRLLTGAEVLFGAVAMGFNILGTLLILALMLLVNADIIGREAFGAPVSGVPELVSLSIVAIVFLQVAQSMRAGRLVRSDSLSRLLPARARSALYALYDLIGAGLTGVLISASWPLFVKAWQRGTFVGAVGDFTAPDWPVKGIIVLGAAALLAQFALSAIRHGLVAAGRVEPA